MSKQVEFRTSLSGFNKKDVNQYIARSTAEFIQEAERSREKIDELYTELAAEKEKNERITAELDLLKSQLENVDNENAELKAELVRSETHHAELNERITVLENQNEELNDRVERLKEERNALKAETDTIPELKEKAERYDTMSGELGEMIISAKKTSCEIIAEAEDDAQRMREDTDFKMKSIKDDAEKKAGNALEAVSSLLHTMAEDTFGEMMTYASEAQFTIGAMFEELKRKSAEINDRIRYINSSSNATVRETIASLPTAVSEDNMLEAGKSGGDDK